MWSLDANRWNRLLTGWSSPGSKTCTPWTLHGTPWPPQHHWALEENIPSTGHEEFKSNTAPYVPQNTERGHLGICLQSFIIAGGACKVNWANLIFMVEPIAAVMKNTFSLLLPPLCVFCGLCFFSQETDKSYLNFNMHDLCRWHFKMRNDSERVQKSRARCKSESGCNGFSFIIFNGKKFNKLLKLTIVGPNWLLVTQATSKKQRRVGLPNKSQGRESYFSPLQITYYSSTANHLSS